MKMSVSLREEDVEFLDAYAEAHALSSRSAAVKRAISALRREELPDAYGEAWDELQAGGEGHLGDRTVGDGL